MSYKYFEIINGVEIEISYDGLSNFDTWKNWPVRKVHDFKSTYWSDQNNQITKNKYEKHLNSSINETYLRSKLNE